ncbi:MAG: MMPL family transporter [Planctomycetia bacterium]|nr:MMPL family transporter [Planctomycetia bacterium]
MVFDRLGSLVSRRWVLVLLFWVVLVAGVHQVAPRWDDVTHDGDFAYLPDRMTSVRGEKLLEAGFPDFFSKSQVALVIAREDDQLGEPDFEVAHRLEAAFPASDDPNEPIAAAWSFETPVIGDKLLSPVTDHGQAALVVLHLRNEFMAIDNMELLRRIHQALADVQSEPGFPPGLKLGLTGSAAVGSDMLFSAEESIRSTETTTIVMVVVILLLVYRAPGLVVIPLVTIGASVVLAMDLVAMTTQLSNYFTWFDFKIFKTTRIFVVVILYGAGTDFCLFLIARYREELQRGLAHPEAIARALGRVGGARAASAMTTILGLGTMFFADFGKFSNSGPAIALCLAVTLAACISLAPAMLRASGRVVFWPFGVATATTEGRAIMDSGGRTRGFWEWLSRAIIARPGLILIGSLLLLAPLIRPVRVLCENTVAGNFAGGGRQLSVPVSYDLLSDLRADRPSVRGTHLLWNYFPADQTGPLTVLAHRNGEDFDSQEGRRKIALLTREFYDFTLADAEGREVHPIVSVRSLTNPMGDKPGSFSPLSAAGRRKLISLRYPKTVATFVSQAPPLAGQLTRFDVVSIYAPFSKESVELLNRIEERLKAKAAEPDSPWQGAEFDFVGTTAGIRDLEVVTTSDRTLIQILVLISVLGVLIAILRRPGICVYLVLSVLLGYHVTIGTTDLLFSWLHPATYAGLDWKVPIFLFVILIAVGEDYNIYLATRVFEEQRRLGPVEGLRVAVVRTGGIITSCGVIMAGTFSAMITGTLRTMQELGFALALGVLLDTFIIRTILVPAFLTLLARREERFTAKEAAEETLSEAPPPPTARPPLRASV